MADTALNDMKGRLAEIIADGGDLIVIPMTSTDADATFEDGYADEFLDTLLLDAQNVEAIGSSWARRVHLNANITGQVDDTNDLWRVILDADSSWTAVLAGNNVTDLLICEDGASDAVRRCIGKWAFAVTTDGNDVNANFDQVNGVWTAA